MSMFQRDPRSGLFFGGDRVSGQEIRDQNGELTYYCQRVGEMKLILSGPFKLLLPSQ